MLETEFIKSMNLNFERTKLEEKPEERRYQYCIVSRGGIRGLLGCSLRFINGDAFLYYDITSKQSLSQILFKKKIDREWLKDFAWNLNHIRQEMSRFLLDDSSVIWYPEQIYRDLDENKWSFMYYPYYDKENGFKRFLEFVIEKLDYDDEVLVECAYKIYEQYEAFGEAYLKDKFFDDIRLLDKKKNQDASVVSKQPLLQNNIDKSEITDYEEEKMYSAPYESADPDITDEEDLSEDIFREKEQEEPKRGLFAFLSSARKKDKETREKIHAKNSYAMELGDIPMVAESDEEYGEDEPEEEYGRTVYMENVAEAKEDKHRLYDEKGGVLSVLGESSLVIGKKKGEADVIIDNSTISRIHARVTFDNGVYMLEDLNSTNGTFKNGLRLRPYERRKLMEGDEIRLGGVNITYK